ncbi:S1/P1 Nuclease [Phenylobacterium deserti]|uniref:S1/P1 Nuclease n=1 Tax=Phenylobacterium deserti TaxID=1914756 RepID=A0A328AEE5_9CAUL|nr:S1/P1 Nuclease [Phenylobacterium deserti]RAK52857.1 S1/P1 Nuclease [Phenylobacterium deserti]
MKRYVWFAAAAVLALAPSVALGWGNTGHRMIGETAVRALPREVPAFLRTAQAAMDVGEFSREPDRSKGAGKVHDQDRDAAHFVDLEDDGRILGGPRLDDLPDTRADYEAALQAVGQNSWKAGYLPYAIIDRRQQLTLDFAYWRVLKAAEANPKWKSHRAFFAADRKRREAQILQTVGQLSHYIGDGSQPLHVTAHYNGWGDYPNPNGYSKAKLHGPFESELVQASVKPQAVAAKVTPLNVCDCSLEQRTVRYLQATGRLVEPFYAMEKAGGLAPGDPRGTAMATQQIAVGASELRDLIVESWRASASSKVGWKPVAVADVEAGKVDPYPALYGVD